MRPLCFEIDFLTFLHEKEWFNKGLSDSSSDPLVCPNCVPITEDRQFNRPMIQRRFYFRFEQKRLFLDVDKDFDEDSWRLRGVLKGG